MVPSERNDQIMSSGFTFFFTFTLCGFRSGVLLNKSFFYFNITLAFPSPVHFSHTAVHRATLLCCVALLRIIFEVLRGVTVCLSAPQLEFCNTSGLHTWAADMERNLNSNLSGLTGSCEMSSLGIWLIEY